MDGAGANYYDFTTDGDASLATITVTQVADVLNIADTNTISTVAMDELVVIAGDTLFLGNILKVTLEDGIGNVNTVDDAAGVVTLASTADVAYILGTLSGSTFTVDSISTTAMMLAWDGNAGDTAAENYLVLTGITFGTPTLALGVLTIV